MIYNQYSLLILSLLLYVAMVLVTAVRIRGKKISPKTIGYFFWLVLLVAGLRFGLYFYLNITLSNYYGSIKDYLSILLYPELPVSRELIDWALHGVFDTTIPLYYYPKFWMINVPLFVFGSLGWLCPVLIFISKKEADYSNSK